jgi:hypothetical protein
MDDAAADDAACSRSHRVAKAVRIREWFDWRIYLGAQSRL